MTQNLKINIIFQYSLNENGPFFENLEKKSKTVSKAKLMPKTAKTIEVPYFLSDFFIKMLLFDIDLFSFCFDMESPR